MVHALEQIYELLKPGGYLIDIHPNGEKVEFYALIDQDEQFIGHMLESDDYIEYFQASEAIETVIERGLFKVEKMMEFEFRNHTDTFDEMKTFLDENWSDAIVTNEVIAKAMALETEHGEFKTILREQVAIGLFQVEKH